MQEYLQSKLYIRTDRKVSKMHWKIIKLFGLLLLELQLLVWAVVLGVILFSGQTI